MMKDNLSEHSKVAQMMCLFAIHALFVPLPRNQ